MSNPRQKETDTYTNRQLFYDVHGITPEPEIPLGFSDSFPCLGDRICNTESTAEPIFSIDWKPEIVYPGSYDMKIHERKLHPHINRYLRFFRSLVRYILIRLARILNI